MKALKIFLNQKYKSFDQGFSQTITGDLVILSGVNGSGKTQLIDIIKGFESNKFNIRIQRELLQNDEVISNTIIAHKSFRDYASIGELTTVNVGLRSQTRDLIYSWYKQNYLDENDQQAQDHKDAYKRARDLLISKFGQEKFNSGVIERDDLKDAIPRDFIIFQDDIFSNKVGEIFFNYLSLVRNKTAEAGELNIPFDRSQIPVAPWKQLNDLFNKLKFDYRFRENYKLIDDEINFQPAIYPLDSNGNIDLKQRRNLSDLSDGEKALIALTFAVFASEQTVPRILLLDEYDASLNPSLIEAFFTILEDFFIARNIQVIVVTHSSATLSLAPENAVFYEVYKRKENRERILEVQRDQYAELTLANKNFYKKIDDQENRFLSMQAKVATLEQLVDELKMEGGQHTKLQIISEGKNPEHIKQALSILSPDLIDKIQFVEGAEHITGKEQMKKAFEIISRITAIPKTLFIWDCDAMNMVDALIESATCKKFCFVQNLSNELIPSGIENLYPEEIFSIETDYDETTKKQ